jgi:hypothetical protein
VGEQVREKEGKLVKEGERELEEWETGERSGEGEKEGDLLLTEPTSQ